MKKLTCAAIAFLCLFTACSRESFTDGGGPDNMIRCSVSATLDSELKTTIGQKEGDKYPLAWTPGDRIAVNGYASGPAEIGENPSKASFEVEVPAASDYILVYPYTEGNEADEVTFAGTTLPMYAEAKKLEANVSFQALYGVLKFSVKGTATLTGIVLTTQDGSQVTGKFAIGTDGVLTGKDATATTLTVNFASPVALDEQTPSEFFIPVPAGTYNILDIQLLDSENTSMTKKIGGGNSYAVGAGKVKEFPAFAYEVNRHLFAITSASDLELFAGLVTEGTFADKYEGAKVYADFEAPEGWTPVDYNGLFDGNGKTISALKAPLFGTLTNAEVRNVRISADMTNTSELAYGALAKTLTGSASVIDNCSVAGTILLDLTGNGDANTYNFAGLVGKTEAGTISNCSSTANVRMDHPGTGAKKINMAAITGELASDATIQECTVTEGMVKANDGNGNNSVEVRIAGIVGMLNTGATVEGCTLPKKKSDSGVVVSARMDVSVFRAGGIAGQGNGTIKDCDNAQGISLSKAKQKVTYAYLGGISGASAGAGITGCTNSGTIFFGNSGGSTVAQTVQTRVGGIVGTIGTTTVANCTNKGTIEYSGNASKSSYFAVGGVVGYADQAITIDGWNNSGSISVSPTAPALGNSAGFRVAIGGLVGLAPKGTVGFTANGSSNSGPIRLEKAIAPTSSDTNNYAYVGGCIGCFRGTPGTYTLENTGDISVQSKNGNGEYVTDIPNVCAGGIIGHTSANGTNNAIFDACKVKCTIMNQKNGAKTGPALLCACSGSNKAYKNCHLEGSMNDIYVNDANYKDMVFLDGSATDKGGNVAPSSEFTIGTYNLWAVSARKSEYDSGKAIIERTWSYSKSIVAEYAAGLNLDILGVQEMAPEQETYLKNEFKKAGLGYGSIVFWPNEKDHNKQSADGIFYRSSRFVLKDWHRYWISKTPEVQSYGWDEGEYEDEHYHYRYRNAGYCHFYDKLTGRDFIVTVIHGPQYPEARMNAALLMKQYEQQLNTARYPSFFIGDMNSNADAVPEDGFNTVMRAWCDDAYKVALKNNGQKYTFAGADYSRTPYVRYDYIYLHSDEADSFLVEEYAVGVDRFDVNGKKCQPSDHCPVYVKVKLK